MLSFINSDYYMRSHAGVPSQPHGTIVPVWLQHAQSVAYLNEVLNTLDARELFREIVSGSLQMRLG